jgi:Zn finger protein HypA/HybF involved in hydrogenase expression
MKDSSLNPSGIKMDHPFDMQTSLSRAMHSFQLPRYECPWCKKANINIMHENSCELNPENIDKSPVCGLCGGVMFPRNGGFKCVNCQTMNFPVEVNEVFINSKLITFDSFKVMNPVF